MSKEKKKPEEGQKKKNGEKNYENLFRESERKMQNLSQENEQMKNELVQIRQMMQNKETSPEKLSEKREELKNMGYEDMLNYFDKELNRRERKQEQRYHLAAKREPHFNSLKREDDTGLRAKYEDEINEVLDQTDPRIWGDKQAMKRIADMVVGRHIGDILEKPSDFVGKESATGDTQPRKEKEKPTAQDREIERYAKQNGLDSRDNEVRKKIVKAINFKKKALKR